MVVPGSFTTNVAGISYRQDAASRCQVGDPVQLIREPENPHDENAIQVLSIDGEPLGYIPRSQSAELAADMDSLSRVSATIKKVTGGYDDKPTIGLVLEIEVSDAPYGQRYYPPPDDDEIPHVVKVVGGVFLVFCLFVALFTC